MTIAIALVSGLLVIGLAVSDAERRAERREQLLRSDPVGLTRPQPDHRASVNAGLLLGILVGSIVAYHLSVPQAGAQLDSRLTAIAMALAASACATYLLIQVNGSAQCTRGEGIPGMSTGQAALAFLLIIFAVCLLATIFVPREPGRLVTQWHPSRLIALAIMTAFWIWLARVWGQQLDEGRPWTTAGMLIPVVRTMSVVAALLGLLTAAMIRFGPGVWWPEFGATASRPWGALLGNGLLFLACMATHPHHRGSWGRPVLWVVAVLALLNLLRMAGLSAPGGN